MAQENQLSLKSSAETMRQPRVPVVINGQEMSFSDTTAALNAGVAIIYQELHLVPEMTVAENIYSASCRIKRHCESFIAEL